MRWTVTFPLLVFALLLVAAAKPDSSHSYKERNPEFGIVYRPIDWDREQWEEIFRDPAPPMGWAIIPVGRESCTALTSWWLDGVRRKGLRPGLITAPFMTKNEIERTIDCSVALGVRRIILDEYVSYQTKNLHRNLCTVLSEVRDIYQNGKRKYPGLQIDIDDNWQTWMVDLARGQKAKACGSYPAFQFDQTGVSVLSKYGNPATGQCGRPTEPEMREQLIDLKDTIRDYAKSRKIFFWQLNQHWYPGTSDVLQLFREAKVLHGWNRFFLWGPTTNNDPFGNWGYNTSASRNGCFQTGFHWYLPARTYLIRMGEGAKARIAANLPSVASSGSIITLNGKFTSGARGVPVQGIQLLITPPANSLQRFERELKSPSRARLAVVGIRVNSQLPHDISGSAQFQLERVGFARINSSSNLILNPEFDRGLNDWLVFGTAPITHGTNGSENFLQANSSSNQSVSVTSLPVVVTPNRSYKVRFDARIFQEARNNAYFFVAWYTTKEIQRDHIFMTFPQPTVVTKTNSLSNGEFKFQWLLTNPGVYTVGTYFPGSASYQPAIKNNRIEIR
jgi:hypothetical protein